MRKYLLLIYIFMLIPIIQSCDPNPNNIGSDATLKTLSDVRLSSAYGEFPALFDAYVPDSAWTDSIKKNFDPAKDSFLIFCKPICSCLPSQEIFPQIMKILYIANIPESNYKIYSCKDQDSKHPYRNYIKLNGLPETFVIKDTIAVYSVVDSIDLIKKTYADSVIKTEKLLYFGLKKNI